ncbi:MAG: helix-turn-helix domain-containing protein [Christensenellales bacterium]|jgi:transcriptional regulator with XRE-family HTH domain
MPYNRYTIGRIIGRLRIQRGISQEVLSGLAGVSRSHLTMIENGRKTMRIDTLWNIAGALGIKLSDLFLMVEEEMN